MIKMSKDLFPSFMLNLAAENKFAKVNVLNAKKKDNEWVCTSCEKSIIACCCQEEIVIENDTEGDSYYDA